jgi:hypothetical protein
VLAGEAAGRWLWMVMRPASAVLLLRDDWILRDVSETGPQLVALPFGGVDPVLSIFWGLLLVLVALGVLFLVGRRLQARARERAAEQRANQLGTGRAARRSRGGGESK